eukprot:4149517-Alexandrium_andersonii.AAC.1
MEAYVQACKRLMMSHPRSSMAGRALGATATNGTCGSVRDLVAMACPPSLPRGRIPLCPRQ